MSASALNRMVLNDVPCTNVFHIKTGRMLYVLFDTPEEAQRFAEKYGFQANQREWSLEAFNSSYIEDRRKLKRKGDKSCHAQR